MQALSSAQELIDNGRPFHAHEVLEAVWKSTEGGNRELWRGLAQVAVGLTHGMRRNERGAIALLRRGADVVGGAGEGARAIPGLADPADIVRAARDLADRIERAGVSSLAAGELRVQIYRQP